MQNNTFHAQIYESSKPQLLHVPVLVQCTSNTDLDVYLDIVFML